MIEKLLPIFYENLEYTVWLKNYVPGVLVAVIEILKGFFSRLSHK